MEKKRQVTRKTRGSGRPRSLKVKLSKKDRARIDQLLNGGTGAVREVKRLMMLRLLDQGRSPEGVHDVLGCSPDTARRVGLRYVKEGLDGAMYEKPRPGKKRSLDASQEAQIVAMVCGAAPEGYARWTIELITAEAMRRKIVKQVSRSPIESLLKAHELKPWREKNVVYRGVGSGIRGADGRGVGGL